MYFATCDSGDICFVNGPDLVFGKLWKETGIQSVLKHLLKGRKFGFDVERAISVTVLHRIMVSGSDLSCDVWRQNQDIPGRNALSLHHFYRAMEWLGESLDEWNDSEYPGQGRRRMYRARPRRSELVG